MNFVQRHRVKVLTVLSSVAVSSFVAETSHAGQKINAPVTINLTNRSISGSIGSTRNSGDNVQFLFITATDGLMQVGAKTASGTQANCVSTDARLVNIALNVPSDATVSIRFDASSNCTSLIFTNDSTAPAKSQ